MEWVVSRDGTEVRFERRGHGPAVILVPGGLDDGAENAGVMRELEPNFTVYNFTRRGRGGSGDTQPYAIEREIEDLDAIVETAGGSAHLYGVSSGGALVLEAAAAGVSAKRIAVYEVPYLTNEEDLNLWHEYVTNLDDALSSDDRDRALELFMLMAGSSEEDVDRARESPVWPGLEEIAHTLRYDALCLADGRPPERLSGIRQPTLVVTGTAMDPHMAALADDFFVRAAEAITTAVPNARRHTIPQAAHVVDAGRMGSLLREFFGGN